MEQIYDSAIVQCKLEEVIVADEYSGWIKVEVLKVILLSELFEAYQPFPTDCKLEEYAGTCECDETDPELVDTSWEIKYWTGQGDIGEWKIIYTDTNEFRHLILMNFYSWFDDVTYFGNIVEIK